MATPLFLGCSGLGHQEFLQVTDIALMFVLITSQRGQLNHNRETLGCTQPGLGQIHSKPLQHL